MEWTSSRRAGCRKTEQAGGREIIGTVLQTMVGGVHKLCTNEYSYRISSRLIVSFRDSLCDGLRGSFDREHSVFSNDQEQLHQDKLLPRTDGWRARKFNLRD